VLAAASADVMVTEVVLPGEDAVQLLREARALHAALPAVALAAPGHPDQRWHALAAGFDAYLTKPVDPGAMIRAVQDLARRRRGA
jgi:DNA-binding response OmpR family regulator